MRQNQAGFTLIEILVAITILSMLMIGVYSIIDNSTVMQEKVTKEDDIFLQLDTALNRVEQDFTHFYSPLYFSVQYVANPGEDAQNGGLPVELSDLKKFRPTERFPGISKRGQLVPAVINESKEEFIFLTFVNQRKMENAKESRYAWVRYSIENNENDGDMKVLVRQFTPDNLYSEQFDWDKAKKQILFSRLKNFTFLFWDAEKEKFVDRLNLVSRDQASPRLIQVKLEWYDHNKAILQEERTYRVLWPPFDALKDDQEYMTALKKTAEGDSGQDPGAVPGVAAPVDPPDTDGGDE
jgi:prepilin-type N-terminal cleavage/methylation domain-containing protein